MSRRPAPEHVTVRNAGDVQQVKRARQIERAATEARRNLVAQQMASYEGRWFVSDLIVAAGIYALSMAADPYVTAFHEGQRDYGLHLVAELTRLCPDEYLLMERERIARVIDQPGAPEPPEPAEPADTTEDDEGSDGRRDDD